MNQPYRPVSESVLKLLGDLEGFTPPPWCGPALPCPVSTDAVQEVYDVMNRMLARGQALIRAQDGLSAIYTLRGITATAERFMLGPQAQVEEAAGVRELADIVQQLLRCDGLLGELENRLLPDLGDVAARIAGWLPTPSDTAPAPDREAGDYTAFPLEDVRQYAMGWTTVEDILRLSYPRLEEFAAAVEDPAAATQQFWQLLSATALPYNLLVLQKLSTANVEPFRSIFGAAWTPEFDALLTQGALYGIDMTIFSGIAPRIMPNGTTRFTPNAMVLLQMTGPGMLQPIAVHVADPQNPMRGQTYLPASSAWIYALLAARTSLTVYGIWLGHVYALHLVTASMQMAMWNTLPESHILHQMLAPHGHGLIAFNFLLLAGWTKLSPPTSIGDSGTFLTLCGRYAENHDYHATDPANRLAALGLDAADFTAPGGALWSGYPNVQRMLHLWDVVATYVQGVVDAGYTADSDVAADTALAAWMAAASAADQGNIAGLPPITTKALLCQMLTSLLYRIIFHGMGRLRSVGNPEPSFTPNFPPCLQSTRIPEPTQKLTTQDLLAEFLPRTGTVGEMVTFYDIFSFNSPVQPLVPHRGAGQDLLFDARFPGANESLVAFRRAIEAIVRALQPDWVQIGQWPMNIEF